MLVLAVTASVWPVFAAYAADLAPRAQPEAQASPTQQPPSELDLYRSAFGIRPEGRSAGLRLDAEAASPPSRHDEARHGYPVNLAIPSPRADDFRHKTAIGAASPAALPANLGTGYASPTAGGSALKLSRAPYAPKTGWEMSGRVGPLRWLSPIDGEGDAQLRLGGRVQGQPRMPGMGLFNVGIHYNFE